MRNGLAVAAVVAVAGWGCGSADADTGSGEGPSAAHERHLVNPAVWTGTTTSGLEVTVRPDPFPIRVGETEFKISIDGPVSEGTPISIDIVSPEMPAMGILRYAAETSGPREYIARAHIGMSGAWEIYVNLGDGTDSAPFAFSVEPGEMGGHMHETAVPPEEILESEPDHGHSHP